MDWSECQKMVYLSYGSDEFYDYVLNHLDCITGQSLQMLIECIQLDKVKERMPFFKKIYEHMKLHQEDFSSARLLIRFSMLELLLKEVELTPWELTLI